MSETDGVNGKIKYKDNRPRATKVSESGLNDLLLRIKNEVNEICGMRDTQYDLANDKSNISIYSQGMHKGMAKAYEVCEKRLIKIMEEQ